MAVNVKTEELKRRAQVLNLVDTESCICRNRLASNINNNGARYLPEFPGAEPLPFQDTRDDFTHGRDDERAIMTHCSVAKYQNQKQQKEILRLTSELSNCKNRLLHHKCKKRKQRDIELTQALIGIENVKIKLDGLIKFF